ncbi:MerR family transcriptional regulator [Inhella sp.]|uniref:MerR family transcriptional regulator n=1 Tax=Inhella sp. TaxID=1921806 RepID=UPI0035B449AB
MSPTALTPVRPALSTQQRFSLDQLAQLSGYSGRTIRYFIAEGLVDRPEGEKRGAHYQARHLEQLQQLRAWAAAGHSHEAMRALRQGLPAAAVQAPAPAQEAWTRLSLAPGVELHLQPERCGIPPAALPALLPRLQALLAQAASAH